MNIFALVNKLECTRLMAGVMYSFTMIISLKDLGVIVF
jgi:hypothetical protein